MKHGLKKESGQAELQVATCKSYFCPISNSQMQILVAMCICLSSASFSVNKAITSAVIFTFQKNADDQLKMTLEEASWLRERKSILQGSAKKQAPGSVNMRRKNCVLLPAAGRRTQFFLLTFMEPGACILAKLCSFLRQTMSTVQTKRHFFHTE